MKQPKRTTQIASPTLLLAGALACGSDASATAAARSAPQHEFQAPAPASGSATVSVSVRGRRNDDGRVIAFLYDDESAFPMSFDQAFAKRASTTLSGNSTTVQFTGVPPGTYALLIFHDENDNGTIDKNVIGIPTEGVGASNLKKRGRPSWSESAFEVSGKTKVSIGLMYF